MRVCTGTSPRPVPMEPRKVHAHAPLVPPSASLFPPPAGLGVLGVPPRALPPRADFQAAARRTDRPESLGVSLLRLTHDGDPVETVRVGADARERVKGKEREGAGKRVRVGSVDPSSGGSRQR